MPRLVMMEGPPGAGKTSLADALCASLRGRGEDVDLVPEEAIFDRAEFAEVGQAFKTREWPTGDLMLSAYKRIFAKRWIVSDWNAVGMIEDLPWAQPDRTSLTTNRPFARADPEMLAGHAAAVMKAAKGLHPTLFVLDVPLDVAIRRAWRERGERWLAQKARYIKPVSGTETLADRVVREMKRAAPRSQDVMDAHAAAGWKIITLDASAKADAVLDAALRMLNV